MSKDPVFARGVTSALWVASRSTKWRDVEDPNVILNEWNSLVANCVDGYHMGFFEYRADLAVRDLLERILEILASDRGGDASNFIDRVQEIDERFRMILKNETDPNAAGKPWWRSRSPRYGGEEFVEEAAVLGISVDLVEDEG
jgi:hypothetical protein